MTLLPLSKEVYDAITAGFSLPELEAYKVDGTPKSLEKYIDIPSVAAHTEAFLDGVAVRKCVNFIFSADSTTDYNNDKARYDATVKRLNQKYGDIFLTIAQVDESPERAYGLAGYRVVPFSRITTTVFPSGKNTVETPRANVEAADEAIRSQLEFTEDN